MSPPPNELPSNEPLRLIGSPGSPYSRKLRAVLRYRRVPHLFVQRGSKDDRGYQEPKVVLLPMLVSPVAGGGEPEVALDSTPLIRRLEAAFEGRSVIPTDPALAFVDALIEDFADEWLTKAMFHYRWTYPPDIEKAAGILPRWARVDAPEEAMRERSAMFRDRQIGRLEVVGSNPITTPVIEASYRRLLAVLEVHFATRPFLFGGRPAASDFALYGQLTQLAAFDPTPASIALDLAPRVVAWVEVLDDLSGFEPGGDDWEPDVPSTLRALLDEVGRLYVPFLLANAVALDSGAEWVDSEIDGRPWRQKPFRYQGKCLAWLRAHYASLDTVRRVGVDRMLEGTGCRALFC
ncbi:MAG TPA: glutathione S-transferase family protein [Thermoanaerobaculia bacterium]|nr:glutathione S-transferase family protein [Thermoanaerobaculia bacterium]